MATTTQEQSDISDPTWNRNDLMRIAFAGDTPSETATIWHDFRTKHVGASDVGGILDKSAFTSPYEIWQRKTGKNRPYPETPQMYWGNVLEPVVAFEYQKRHPEVLVRSPLSDFAKPIVQYLHESEYAGHFKVLRAPSMIGDDTVTPDHVHRFMYENKNIPLAVASPDRIITKKNTGETWGLEIKTTASWSGWEPGTFGENNSPNVVPYAYYLQVLWSMMVMDLDRWDLAVLICGSTYREYTFIRDKKLEAEIYKQIEHWWEAQVEGDVPPSMSGHESLNHILRDAYPSSNKSYLQADSEVNEMIEEFTEELVGLDEQSRKVEALKQEFKARIQKNRGIDGATHILDWIRYEGRNVKWKDLAQNLAREYTGKSDIDQEILDRWTKTSTKERFSVRKKSPSKQR